MTREKSYHIYLEDKVLFKNLERELFEIIWDRLYHSYYTNEIEYEEIEYTTDQEKDLLRDASY